MYRTLPHLQWDIDSDGPSHFSPLKPPQSCTQLLAEVVWVMSFMTNFDFVKYYATTSNVLVCKCGWCVPWESRKTALFMCMTWVDFVW